MNVYKTVLYTSLETPLRTVVICNANIDNELYRGPFESIPKLLFDREVNARLYEKKAKMLKIWVRSQRIYYLYVKKEAGRRFNNFLTRQGIDFSRNFCYTIYS